MGGFSGVLCVAITQHRHVSVVAQKAVALTSSSSTTLYNAHHDAPTLSFPRGVKPFGHQPEAAASLRCPLHLSKRLRPDPLTDSGPRELVYASSFAESLCPRIRFHRCWLIVGSQMSSSSLEVIARIVFAYRVASAVLMTIRFQITMDLQTFLQLLSCCAIITTIALFLCGMWVNFLTIWITLVEEFIHLFAQNCALKRVLKQWTLHRVSKITNHWTEKSQPQLSDESSLQSRAKSSLWDTGVLAYFV